MRAGKLDHRIKLQAYVSPGKDPEGIPLPTQWTTVATVWAEKRSVSGREFYAAQAVNSEKDVHWRIRYRDDIDSTMRVFEPSPDGTTGKAYALKAPPLDEDGRKRELLLITEAVNADG